MIYALENTKELDVRVKDKTKRDCDLIVDNIGVGLKTSKRATWSNLRKAFKHEKADLYMFVTWYTERLGKSFDRYIRNHGYEMEYKELAERGWRVLIVKRTEKTQ